LFYIVYDANIRLNFYIASDILKKLQKSVEKNGGSVELRPSFDNLALFE